MNATTTTEAAPVGGAFRCGNVYSMEAPPAVQPLLRRLGGVSPYGDPIYRLVWGWDAKRWKNGREVRWFDDGYRERRHLERFHIFKWLPWWKVATSRAEWRADLDGPFPYRGHYEPLLAIEEASTGAYVRPSEEIARETYERNRDASARNEDRVRLDILAAEEAKKMLHRKRCHDVMVKNLAAFPGKSWISAGSSNTAKSRRLSHWRT